MFRFVPSFFLLVLLSLAAVFGAACAQQPVGSTTRASPEPEPALVVEVEFEAPREVASFEYFGGLEFDESIPTPREELGYDIGEQFTRHHDVVRYLTTLAASSDRLNYREYGRSHEDRALTVLTISSPENISRIEEILAANRELADPENLSEERAQEIIASNPAIVWLSYNVHGNEASCTESAMQMAYTLAAAQNPEVLDVLDDLVIVIDPVLNPDGRDRYVNFYRAALGTSGPNPSPIAAEHMEPWPGGRTNHFYFDLNRDWIWLTQPESAARLKVYLQVLPQLHIDYHEQGHHSPYFFGAGDDPYNLNIPAATREWVNRYGEANALAFDREGLVYATRERFDYLYPGYGKVLPTYHGAVGMLCEKGGHGRAGLSIELDEQSDLTLAERAYHHFLTGMSYLETTRELRAEQLDRFRRYFADSLQKRDGTPLAFIISAENDRNLLEKIWRLCDSHGVRVDEATEAIDLGGAIDMWTGEAPEVRSAPAGSWVIWTDQPRGHLVAAAFERSTFVTDIETYDITGWSAPVVFGMQAWSMDAAPRADVRQILSFEAEEAKAVGGGDVAILVDSTQHRFPVGVGVAMRHELTLRKAGAEFTIGGQTFSPGSLIIYAKRNHERDLKRVLRELLDAGLDARLVDTGLTETGHVLGVNDNWHMDLPNVALLRGDPLNPYSFGQTWHLLDREMPIPHTALNIIDVTASRLDEFNVVVIPDTWGDLDRWLGEHGADAIRDWVEDGGVLVTLAGASEWAESEVLEFGEDEDSDESDEDEGDEEDRPAPSELSWEEREDREVEDNVPGALLAATLDTTHPLAGGLGERMPVLKRSDRMLEVEDDTFVLVRFDPEERLVIGGVISDRNVARLAGTPAVTHHEHGHGAVICFSDDPTVRGFLHRPMRLLMNVIVFSPSL